MALSTSAACSGVSWCTCEYLVGLGAFLPNPNANVLVALRVMSNKAMDIFRNFMSGS